MKGGVSLRQALYMSVLLSVLLIASPVYADEQDKEPPSGPAYPLLETVGDILTGAIFENEEEPSDNGEQADPGMETEQLTEAHPMNHEEEEAAVKTREIEEADVPSEEQVQAVENEAVEKPQEIPVEAEKAEKTVEADASPAISSEEIEKTEEIEQPQANEPEAEGDVLSYEVAEKEQLPEEAIASRPVSEEEAADQRAAEETAAVPAVQKEDAVTEKDSREDMPEATDQKRKSIIILPVLSIAGETTSALRKNVEDTVAFTEGTVQGIASPKPVSSILENTTGLLGNTVNNTLPVLDTTADVLPETLSSTVSTVTSTTNDTLEATSGLLPEVPVVTPVVGLAQDTVHGVTHTVDSVVGTTGDVLDHTVTTTTDTVREVTGEVTRPQTSIPAVNESEGGHTPQFEEDQRDHAEETPAIITAEKEAARLSETPEMIETSGVEERPSHFPVIQEAKSTEALIMKEPKALSDEKTGQSDFQERRELEEQNAPTDSVRMDASMPTGEQVFKLPAKEEPHSSQSKNWSQHMALTHSSTATSTGTASVSASGDSIPVIFSPAYHWMTFHDHSNAAGLEQVKTQWMNVPPGQPPKQAPFLYS